MMPVKMLCKCKKCKSLFSGTKTCTEWIPEKSIIDSVTDIFKPHSFTLPKMLLNPECPKCGSKDYEVLN